MTIPLHCLAVDTGGTFTDYVGLESDGTLRTGKVPSTPEEPTRSIERVLHDHPVEADGLLLHGTTVGTNTLLEDEMAAVTLVTNRGLEGLVRLGRGTRHELYELNPNPDAVDVYRDLEVVGVPLRDHPDSPRPPRSLTARESERLRERIREQKPAVVAVCLVHAYRDPGAERDVRRALEPLDVDVVLSSEVHGRFREFERASTTIVNAGLRPRLGTYQRRLKTLSGVPERILMMGSSRGVVPPAEMKHRPVLSVLSGPAAGLLGARSLARRETNQPVLAMDVGGTSTDVGVIRDRQPLRDDHSIGGYPIAEPMVDVHTIGSGGGSVLWIDRGGHLRVGPHSAGADPGPACYGLGGPPTLTDAQVMLGRIPADRPLSPEVTLDSVEARRALEELGQPLSMTPRELARGALRIARSRLGEALRAVTVKRGEQPDSFCLVAYGGAGGLFAAQLARELDVETVFVPRVAGVASALGLLDAPETRQRSVSPLTALEASDSRLPGLDRVRRRGPEWGEPSFETDCRFAGQTHEISIPVDPNVTQRALRERFFRRYQKLYDYRPETDEVELVNLTGYWERTVELPSIRWRGPSGTARKGTRSVDLGDRVEDVPVFDLEVLADSRPGPAVLTGSTTTVFVPRDFRVEPCSGLLVELKRS